VLLVVFVKIDLLFCLTVDAKILPSLIKDLSLNAIEEYLTGLNVHTSCNSLSNALEYSDVESPVKT
jgi:hypothetical protein